MAVWSGKNIEKKMEISALKNSYVNSAASFFVLFLLLVLGSCGGDDSNDSTAGNTCEPSVGTESDLTGNWVISSIEGVSANDPLVSEFTIYSTGTYDWSFMISSASWTADIAGTGNFSLASSKLFIDGRFAESVISENSVELSFCNNNTVFSFVDTYGDRWTYAKQ